jgi:hypothetical protein
MATAPHKVFPMLPEQVSHLNSALQLHFRIITFIWFCTVKGEEPSGWAVSLLVSPGLSGLLFAVPDE